MIMILVWSSLNVLRGTVARVMDEERSSIQTLHRKWEYDRFLARALNLLTVRMACLIEQKPRTTHIGILTD